MLRAEQSLLQQVVADRLNSFLARAEERTRVTPHFVDREFCRFLECGISACGFVGSTATDTPR